MLLSHLVQRKTFVIGSVRRAVHKYLAQKQQNLNFSTAISASKPSGLHVEEMFDEKLFQSGTIALHPSTYSLKIDRLTHYHVLSCPKCSVDGSLQPTCYFTTMLKCITHGWRPPFLSSISPQYQTTGNYPTISNYHASVDAEFQEMLTHGVLIPHIRRSNTITSPLGAIIKNSDKVRALTLVNINITNQTSLSAASNALIAIGQPKVKCRITTDSTASGLNRACYTPPFQYPSLADTVSLLYPGCYMAIGDIMRFFHSFPVALDDRHQYCIEYGGVIYTYARCWFGFSACPYYCSAWSAEFRRMATALGLPTGHMMDDWLTLDKTLEQVKQLMSTLTFMFTDIGLVMAEEKFRYGQVLVYLGVLIDTNAMTIRFEATQSKAVRIQLSQYLDLIISGKHLDATTIRHVCGKLNWYAEVVQSGRIHIKTWWLYDKYGKTLSNKSILHLVSDTQWWISLLISWENNQDHSLATYPILSADIILSNPLALYCIQSDASGPDGFGYYYSTLSDKDPKYCSSQWEPPLTEDQIHNSHAFELRALEHFVRAEAKISKCILVWLTDSESAVYSINKGVCKNKDSLKLIESILHLCDLNKISIVAIWIPREENILADYLSHLATNLNISHTRGNISEILEGRPIQKSTA